MQNTADVVRTAYELGLVIPAFNVPHLPMVAPVIRAVADLDAFALVEVARLEWTKMEAGSPRAIMAEFLKWNRPEHVRLHLDHIPVIDEDNQQVDYLAIIQEAIDLGYQSVMVDGSRLPLKENIAVTKKVVELAHKAGIPCEAELGSVLGHEEGPIPPYDELFASGMGFTRVAEAQRFVKETGCDWLSVAIGSFHGPVSAARRDQKKVEGRLNLELLAELREATGIPLVLHGGSGVRREHVLAAIKKGIAKINVGTEIRQAYEVALKESGNIASGQEAVYWRVSWFIRDYFGLSGSRRLLVGEGSA